MTSLNKKLQKAKSGKNDEFYTQLPDIENELDHYKTHFKDKVIYCNCDNPEQSNFWKYFEINFEKFGLRKLISTHYLKDQTSYKMEIIRSGEGYKIIKTPLNGDGDFRNTECIEILKQSDIVVTNPPFSLFREYISQLFLYDKKFIIIGNINAISCRDIFPMFMKNKIWLGHSKNSRIIEFRVPDSYTLTQSPGNRVDSDGNKYIKIGIRWFTNLDHGKINKYIVLSHQYSDKYLKYDNYDAIDVSKVCKIPFDYYGKMGVPITFLDKYNPNQFEILGIDRYIDIVSGSRHRFIVRGVNKYIRVVIRLKKQETPNSHDESGVPFQRDVVFDYIDEPLRSFPI